MLMFLFFFALWLLFNGRLGWDVAGVGLVLSALVTLFAVKVCGWSDRRSRWLLKIAHLPRVNTITDDMMHQLEERFGVKGREGYLD